MVTVAGNINVESLQQLRHMLASEDRCLKRWRESIATEYPELVLRHGGFAGYVAGIGKNGSEASDELHVGDVILNRDFDIRRHSRVLKDASEILPRH